MKVFLVALSLTLLCMVAAQHGRGGGHSSERRGGNDHGSRGGGRGGPPGRFPDSRSSERFPFPQRPQGPRNPVCRQCPAIRNGCTSAGCVSPFVRYLEEHEGSCMMAVITCQGRSSSQLLTEFGNVLANGFSIDEVASCINGQWSATDGLGTRRTFSTLRCMVPQVFG